MERKERILRKALSLYGVSDEEQASFLEDLNKFESDEPQDEEMPVETEEVEEKVENEEVEQEPAEVEEQPVEEAVEDEKVEPVEDEEPKNEEVVKDNVEEAVEEPVSSEEQVAIQPTEPSVDYDAKITALEETIQAQKDQIAKLYEMVGALGIPTSDGIEEHNPFGNQKISPMPRENEDDDFELRRRLGGGKY